MTATELFDQRPPSNIEAERSLLGSLILDARNVDKVSRLVSGADFHDSANGNLFDAIVSIQQAGLPIGDMTVLRAELGKLRLTEQWPSTELAALAKAATGNHATYYADQVRKCSRCRRYIDIANGLALRAADPSADADDVAAWLATQLDSVHHDRSTGVRSVGEVAIDVLDDLDSAGATGRGLMTGLISIDKAVGSMMPGESWVLAARPGLGKTSLAMQIAQHNAERDRSVLFVSLEMSDRELIQRLICSRSQIDQRLVRNGSLTRNERQMMIAAGAELGHLLLRVWSPSTATIQDIRATARLEQKTVGLSMLIIDYLQLVAPARGDERRTATEQVTNVSNAVKRLAKELSVPVLVLAQLNRESEKTKTRPSLGHLRQSGAIEQDADVVMFLHRDPDNRAKPETELLVAKHRHGIEGMIPLYWIGHHTRYADANDATPEER